MDKVGEHPKRKNPLEDYKEGVDFNLYILVYRYTCFYIKCKEMKNMRQRKKEKKILFTVLIVLFIMFNYNIVAYGHSLTYDLETNNCVHMSQRLENTFELFGIPVTLVTGANLDGNRHMWISLWNYIELDSVNLLPFQNAQFNLQRIEYMSFNEYEKR